MRKLYLRILLSVVILAGYVLQTQACRFTVREIGFSVLSESLYPLLIVDEDLNYDDPAFKKIHEVAEQSNLSVLLLDPRDDASHPLLRKAVKQGISFPNVLFCTPRENIYPVYEKGTYSFKTFEEDFFKKVLTSPLRKKMLEDVAGNFAYVIHVSGKDKAKNRQVEKQIREACGRVKDIMALMPKKVDNPPQVLQITEANAGAERILLNSLGFRELPEQPYAVVVYGRGRFMGKPLTVEEVEQGLVYKYLAMIGADCECNLDRQWMLGTQLPLSWDEATRQQLAEGLTFDVDNPSILAEMSRILSKEEVTGESTTSFTPETIDLDEVFQSSTHQQKETDDTESLMPQSIFITLLLLLFVAVFISILIFRKSKQ